MVHKSSMLMAQMFRMYVLSGDVETGFDKFLAHASYFKVGESMDANDSSKLRNILIYQWNARQYSSAAEILSNKSRDFRYQNVPSPGLLYLHAARCLGKARTICQDLNKEGERKQQQSGIFEGDWLGLFSRVDGAVPSEEDLLSLLKHQMLIELLESSEMVLGSLESAKHYFSIGAKGFCSNAQSENESERVAAMINYMIGREYFLKDEIGLSKAHLIQSIHQYTRDGWSRPLLENALVLRECFRGEENKEMDIILSLYIASLSTSLDTNIKEDLESLAFGDLSDPCNLLHMAWRHEEELTGQEDTLGTLLLPSIFEIAEGWINSEDSSLYVFALKNKTSIDIPVLHDSPTKIHFTNGDIEIASFKESHLRSESWNYLYCQPRQANTICRSVSLMIGPSIVLDICMDALTMEVPSKLKRIRPDVKWGRDMKFESLLNDAASVTIPDTVLCDEILPISIKGLQDFRKEVCYSIKMYCEEDPKEPCLLEASDNEAYKSSILLDAPRGDCVTIWAKCPRATMYTLQVLRVSGGGNEIAIIDELIAVSSVFDVSLNVKASCPNNTYHIMSEDAESRDHHHGITLPCGCTPVVTATVFSKTNVSIELGRIHFEYLENGLVKELAMNSTSIFLSGVQEASSQSQTLPVRDDEHSVQLSGRACILWRRIPSLGSPSRDWQKTWKDVLPVTIRSVRPLATTVVSWTPAQPRVGELMTLRLTMHNDLLVSGTFRVDVEDSEDFLVHGSKTSTISCMPGTSFAHQIGVVPYHHGFVALPKFRIGCSNGSLQTQVLSHADSYVHAMAPKCSS